MKDKARSKLVLRFGQEGDDIAVYCNGIATIAELHAAIESLKKTLRELLDMQEKEFIEQMEMAYKDMIKED